MVAQLVVGDAANAEKPISPALGCATVEATATNNHTDVITIKCHLKYLIKLLRHTRFVNNSCMF